MVENIGETMGLEELFSRVRKSFQDPHEILVNQLGLRSGEKLLDIGCGTGFLSIPASEVVGPDGMVYAIDKDPRRIETLRKEIERRRIWNVVPILWEAERLDELSTDAVDKAVMLFSLHHFNDAMASLSKTRAKLKNMGYLLIKEPNRKVTLGHGTTADEIIKMAEEVGFRVETTFRGPFTWGALLKKES